MIDPALESRLAALFAERDRHRMAPTIAALLELLGEHPHDPVVLSEVGGAYDTDGQEETAADYCRQALELGLEGERRRRCLLQYGSTLRNLGRFEESLALLAAAREDFPSSESLVVFEALSLHAAGRPSAALATVLELVAERLDSPEIVRYEAAIRGNAEYLRTLD